MSIEWTDRVWNPVTGCTRVSAGCDHCYAVTTSHVRGANPVGSNQKKYAGLTIVNGAGDRHFTGEVRIHPEELAKPLGWRRPQRVFVNSMSDLFHRDVPASFLDRVFAVMAIATRHNFQILTKRPSKAFDYLIDNGLGFRWKYVAEKMAAQDPKFAAAFKVFKEIDIEQLYAPPLYNVWLGVSCEDQATFDDRMGILAALPPQRDLSKWRTFVSLEPLLGPIDCRAFLHRQRCPMNPKPVAATRELGCGGDNEHCGGSRIDWGIVGGESGPRARECHRGWIYEIVHQFKAAGVPIFVKQEGSNPVRGLQLGERENSHGPHGRGSDFGSWPEWMQIRQIPEHMGAF